ncbi:MAG: ABC transporter permease subunit [Myxococcota bacterium]
MIGTLSVARKELLLYLTTWTSYALFAVFLQISGFFFYELLEQFQRRRLDYIDLRAVGIIESMNLNDMVLAPMFGSMAGYFIFIMPLLTMRLMVGEQRRGTLELLLTAPIKPIQIIVGKFLATICVMEVMLSLTLIFPVVLHVFGTSPGGSIIDWRSVTTAYIGLTLLGAASTPSA